MRLIWATRGRDWGFRFLRDGGLSDPIFQYEAAFAGIEDDPQVCRRVGEVTALRIVDPGGRRDRAGRLIPHDFVLFDALATAVGTAEDGLNQVWPLVSDDYEAVWESPTPPATT